MLDSVLSQVDMSTRWVVMHVHLIEVDLNCFHGADLNGRFKWEKYIVTSIEILKLYLGWLCNGLCKDFVHEKWSLKEMQWTFFSSPYYLGWIGHKKIMC